MTNWTEQQKAAIEDRGRSVIVSAAAGSGKTAVLVERLLRILSDTEHRTPAESMVVVTFTNDAAAQMKQRLHRALSEKLALLDASDADEESALWLMHQQSALGSAKISTINAFCFDLIRENADLCGVSSQFSIVEPAAEAVYVRRAMHEVMDRWNKQHPDLMEMLYSHFCTKNDDELEDVVLRLAGFLKSLAFPEQWMDAVRREIDHPARLLLQLRDTCCQGFREVLSLAEQSRPYAEQAGSALKKNPFLELLEADLYNIGQHLKRLESISDDELLANPLQQMTTFADFPRVRKDVDQESKNVFQIFRDMYKEKYKKLTSDYLSPLCYFKEDQTAQMRIIPPLLELTQNYCDTLFEVKKRRNVLSFDDGERLALSLLGELQADGTVQRTQLGDRLSETYNIIMVDEYQDSNNKQDYLFKLLSRDSGISKKTGRLCYGTNAFLVGDVKQSIYSFRLANPQNFMHALEESTMHTECAPGEFARIYLNQNFRSSTGVVDFVNDLFHTLMTKACGEVDYDENERLNFGAAHYTDCPDTRTQLLFPYAAEGIECEDVQALCIAETIADMLHRKVQVVERNGKSRDCSPADFCILLRSVKHDGSAMQRALQAQHIPVSGDEESEFLQLPEIQLIRSILQILDNPLTDIAMTAVLLSPICGFTPDDLAMLKTCTGSKRLYLQLRRMMSLDVLSDVQLVLREKAAAFLELHEALRSDADALPLEELIQEIYDKTDLLSLQALYSDADKRRSHLMDFCRFAQSFRKHADLNGTGGLSSWLRHLEHVEESGKDLEAGPLPPVQLDAVCIKTIHKSKGLEYPFVFVAHTEREFFHSQGKSPILPDDGGLLGLKLYDRETCQKSSTAAHCAVLAETRRKQRSEELRLFYVALTRAQQQLFLVMDSDYCRKYCLGTKPKEGTYKMQILLEAAPSTVSLLAPDAGCMADWVVQYLLSTGQGDALLNAIDMQSSGRTLHADFATVETGIAAHEETTEKIETAAVPDEEAEKIMRQQLTFSYHSTQMGLISKHSVTGLSHPQNAISERMRDPAFLQKDTKGNDKKLRGAERGTAVHKIMQYIDFSDASADPQNALRQMLAEGILTQPEMDAIGAEKLDAFFRSPLYKRIAGADRLFKEKQFFVKIADLDFPKDTALHRSYAGTDGILIGTMDLLFHDESGWVLVDYKTDYARDAEPLLKQYSLQLGLYCKAAERILGEPVRQAYLYAFSLDAALEVNPEAIDYNSLEAHHEHEGEN